jgi:two-component system, sensor histidine kinase and response regulator
MEKASPEQTQMNFPNKTELLETIFQTAQEAIVVTRDRIVKYINPEFTVLFGYTEDEVIEKNLEDLIRPMSSRSKAESDQIGIKLAAGERIEYETVRFTKHGRLIHVLVRLSPIFVNDELVGGYSLYTDISKRKRVQDDLKKAYDELEIRVEQRTKELKESEKRFRDLYEHSLDAIIMHEKGIIIDVNKSMCQLLGYSKENLLNMQVIDLHPLEDRDALREEIKLRDKFIQFETRWVKADGSSIDVEINSNKIDAEGHIYLVIARNITERKEGEKKLAMSEEMNRVLVQNIAITLNLIDTNYTLLIANTASAEKRGLTAINILGRKCYEVFENRDSVCPHCLGAKAIETGLPQKEEITVTVPDAGLADMEFQAFPVFGKGGKVTAFIETVRDVTEAKRLATEFKKAKEAAVQANTAKSQFLANMSHEIRTPLNGVMGVLNLLLATNPDNEQLDLIDTGKRSADNLLTIINDVLDFSKIEAGELDLELLNFNLRTAIAEVLELPAIQAHNKGLEIAYSIHEDIPALLKGDPGRLRQILLNLISNAIKFTEKGEILVKALLVSEKEGRVTIRFEVIDTGIGIPQDKQEMIFEAFKQTDASTTRMYGGTGLGLSISKRLSELMGGEIGVTSEPGKGSTFWFTVQFDKQADFGEEKPITPVDIRGKRFLVVDDNKTNQMILKGYIEAWGCFCDLADSAEMALSMMNAVAKVNAPFDAILIDMQMPVMDGADLGKCIKNDPVLKDNTIIMLTSQGIRGDASRMEKIGFAAYLTKPIRRSHLFDCLMNVLSRETRKGHENRRQIVTRYTISEEKRKKTRILLVEDNIINQKLALKLIEKFGFKADSAANGKEAIKALESFRYDIVLMDIQMPEMDGLEATRIIRDPSSSVIDHSVKIIAMTAHAMQGDRDRCINAGMNDYTIKPIRPQELLDAIERQIEKISLTDPSSDLI